MDIKKKMIKKCHLGLLITGSIKYVIVSTLAFACFLLFTHLHEEEGRMGINCFTSINIKGIVYSQLTILLPLFILYFLVIMTAISLAALGRHDIKGFKKIRTGRLLDGLLKNMFKSFISGVLISLIIVAIAFVVTSGSIAASSAEQTIPKIFPIVLPGLILRASVLSVYIASVVMLLFGFNLYLEKEETGSSD